MTLSRRALLVGGCAATALTVLAGCTPRPRTIVDVRDFGAAGDGIADDSAAIQNAAAALRPGGTLRFPAGTYRFAERWPRNGAAIAISGMADVAVEFEPGAELFMDNLHPVKRTGSSHGLLVRGPASRIRLQGVDIRWADGARRSLGDGIRVEGYPDFGGDPPRHWAGDRTPVTTVSLTDCTVRSSPQTGVMMAGVSDIRVTGLRVLDSGADGLHFNACRAGSVQRYSAVNTGDDGLALVTYFAPKPTFDRTARTFAYPDLTDWSNTDFEVGDVTVFGCRANGVRLAGANRVTLTGVDVVGGTAGSAFFVDSAEPGSDVRWNYVASRGIRLDDATATNCDIGVHLLARPGTSGDRRFTEFDVRVGDAKIDDCTTWAVRAESLTGTKAQGLRIDTCTVTADSTTGGNGGVGVGNADAVTFGTVAIRQTEPVTAFAAENASGLTVDHLGVAVTRSDRAESPKQVVDVRNCDGVIGELSIGWPAADAAWTPVRLSTADVCAGGSDEAPLTIRELTVSPPVARPSVVGCAR